MPQGNGGNDDGNGGTNNGNGGSRGRGSASESNSELLNDMRELMQQMLQGNNVSQREQTLIRDNFKLRRRNAQMREQLESASAGKVPDGSVVVKKADADELEKFRALKLTPDVITASMQELTKLKTESAARENEAVHEEAAEALGYPNVAALSKALKREGLHVEMKSVRADDPDNPGKKISVLMPHVRKASDEKAALEPLADYIDRELSELVPAFVAEPETDDSDDDAGSASSTSQANTITMRRDPKSPAARGSNNNGVSIPVARSAQRPNGPAREAKQTEEAAVAKKRSGTYSL
jgi:hypothetical protein